MMKKCIVLVILFLIGAACSMPPRKVGVLVRQENIEKSSFVEGVRSPIKILEGPCKDKIFLVGGPELKIFERDGGRLLKHIKYDLPGEVQINMINGSFYIGIRRTYYVGLMDNMGKLIWRYPVLDSEQFHTNEMVGGDLNDDRVLEFYVATIDGLHVLDNNGKLINKYLDDTPLNAIKIYRYNNRKQLVLLNYIKRKLYFLEFNGKLVKTLDIGNRPMWDLSVINWPSENHLLLKDGNRFYVMDFDGNIIFKKNVGFAIMRLRGTGVYLKDDRKYFAVLTKLKAVYGKSILWIYSPEGDLIYKEAMCTTEAITAIKDKSSNKEHLWVGGWSSINKYEMH